MKRDESATGRAVLAIAIATTVSWLLASAAGAVVGVNYRADFKAWKAAATSSDTLSFSLHDDENCANAALHQEDLVAGDMTLSYVLVKPKKIKGGIKPTKEVLIRTNLMAGAVAGPLFLELTGTGIVPIGDACQVQESVTGSGNAGPPGLDGLDGAEGPEGPTGPPGPPGPGFAQCTVRQGADGTLGTTIASFVNVTVSCLAGEVAVGGGCRGDTLHHTMNPAIFGPGPVDNTPNQFNCLYTRSATSVATNTVFAHAVCCPE